MKEDVELAIRCKKPVDLCCRVGGMIPTPDEVLEHIKKLAEGHIEIIEALLAHDETRVREAMGAHIRMSRVRLEAYLNTHTNERLQLRP